MGSKRDVKRGRYVRTYTEERVHRRELTRNIIGWKPAFGGVKQRPDKDGDDGDE